MPARPAWKGYLKLSLVTCAVELSNATTQGDKVSFRVINRKTGNTVKRQYVDAETGKAVADKDQVKGYETGDDEFLLIEEEDLDAVQIESSHTLSLDGFVAKNDIDPVYLDTPYYLAPADKVSEEAFTAIRAALEEKKMAGLASIVLYRRERPVLVEPFGKRMLVTTLRYDKTVRSADAIFDDIKKLDVDDEMIDIASDILAKKVGKFDPSTFKDQYQEDVSDLIEGKKVSHKKPKADVKPAKQSNVVNLFDALKKSLEAEDGGKTTASKKPAGRAKKTD